ncbi:MAG TPA: hypothetical protein VI320_35235 [Terracidiphilus sp.]
MPRAKTEHSPAIEWMVVQIASIDHSNSPGGSEKWPAAKPMCVETEVKETAAAWLIPPCYRPRNN